ncbi:hypothetical protein B4U37_16565 [Sutcliffiella horikoshii]|uniref:Uncharacterized protein n=1 Tax=Sutcliffiella horikoshii TaxID=79883 RepID=A0ABN4ZM27_9BACI|nr:hypothetical protein B4U37_16565 [Sutcliffiella horikoshii]
MCSNYFYSNSLLPYNPSVRFPGAVLEPNLGATKKSVYEFKYWIDTAVDFRKWLRFPRGAA